jgi:hypothetical protein
MAIVDAVTTIYGNSIGSNNYNNSSGLGNGLCVSKFIEGYLLII